MITFPLVKEIESGDPLNSDHLTQLARAINARIRSGLGDPTYRLAYYADSLFRQIRNPDADGFLWPSRSEFLEVYQHTQPAEFTWPVAGPGEPEGINVASMAGEFVFGAEATGTLPEDERIADTVPLWLGLIPPETPEQRWELGKQQRGAVDPETGGMYAPAFDAARAHYQILRNAFSAHGNSYGGFIPTPVWIGDCTDGDSEHAPSPNYDIFFTALRAVTHNAVAYEAGDELHYAGSCPREDGHVAFVYIYPPDAYVVGVWVNNGVDPPTVAIDLLALADWIQGPYSGGNRLSKLAGDHLPRMLNYFSAQFRGTPTQRAEPGKWLANAFDTQRFFTTQYMLAPAKGRQVGDTIEPAYPRFEFYGSTVAAAGTKLRTLTDDRTRYACNPGFVIVSVFVQAKEILGETRIDVFNGESLIGSVTLTEEDPADVIVFSTPVVAGEEVSVVIGTQTEFETATQTSGVIADFAEIMEYKPWPHDHMLVLRLGGCRLDLLNGTDGFGMDEVGSRELGENYFRWGMALNLRSDPGPAGSFAEINTNAPFESARRMFRCIRILRRHHLLGYEVVDGKSILYLDRWTFGQGGNAPQYDENGGPILQEVFPLGLVARSLYIVKGPPAAEVIYAGETYTVGQTFRAVPGDSDFVADGGAHVYLVTQYLADSGFNGASGDVLDGIAPSPFEIPSGSLKWGYKYVVVGGTNVAYAGTLYTPGQVFTATEKDIEYTETGGATVYEADGIRHAAPPQNFTNEWMCGFQFKVYHPSESSTWKPDAYSDYFSFSERCHFYPSVNVPPLNDQAKRHFAYGSRFWIAPEAVTGYRYALGLNKVDCDLSDAECIERRTNFYKSCRLYEPDIEIDKAELIWEFGQQRVKLTLKSRLHHCEGVAPSSVPRDPTGWDVDALRAEPYRTEENAIREYIVLQSQGINCQLGAFNGAHQPGNSAYNSSVWLNPDNPFGSCFPSIFLTQLIPEPYQDANAVQDLPDTPFLHDQFLQSELYIRGICEGYVDGRTTLKYGCTTGIEALFDYTFENLCFDAFEGRWFPPVATTVTSLLKEKDIRTDFPMGFGPLPNTLAAAEMFNMFARAVNRLDKVRVMLPYLFETRTITGSNERAVAASNPEGSSTRDCEASPGFPGFYWVGVPPDASANVVGSWEESTSASSGIEAKFKALSTIPSTYDCSGTQFYIITNRTDSNFRFKLAHPDSINAIPPGWRDMLDTNGAYIAKYTETEEVQGIVDVVDGSDCFATSNWWNISLGHSLSFTQTDTTTVDRCEIWSNSGTIHAPAIKTQALGGGWVPGDTNGACIIPAGNSAALFPFASDGIMLQIPVV